MEFQLDEPDCLRDLDPVSPLAQLSASHWDVIFLCVGGGQHFAHVVKGNCRGDAPGHQLD